MLERALDELKREAFQMGVDAVACITNTLTKWPTKDACLAFNIDIDILSLGKLLGVNQSHG